MRFIFLVALLTKRASAAAPESVEGDVVVYGATLSGCIAAISASRSGAKNVVLATPYIHVGGMTTGGLQHADSGNEVCARANIFILDGHVIIIIAFILLLICCYCTCIMLLPRSCLLTTFNKSTTRGVTGEFFERVMAHYNPAPSPPKSRKYTCRANRCIEVVDDHGHPTPDQHCANACPPLGPDEWLAVTFLSRLSDDNRTLTVTLKPGHNTSELKKSEENSEHLPASMKHTVGAISVPASLSHRGTHIRNQPPSPPHPILTLNLHLTPITSRFARARSSASSTRLCRSTARTTSFNSTPRHSDGWPRPLLPT